MKSSPQSLLPTLFPFRKAGPALTAACALFFGIAAQAQPAISTIYPDGSVQFQPTNTLAFSLVPSFGSVTPGDISIQLAATNLDGTGSSQLLTSTNGLTITGPASGPTVTTPLTSNTVYTAIIQATDGSGTLVQTNVFDTITPSYTWEAEDYDYGGGQFIDNPQTNTYAGLVAYTNVDAYNPNQGGQAYRPVDPTAGVIQGNLGNENCSDIPRIQYSSSGLQDYDQGWNNAGSGLWGNYTRHYPAGKWNIFVRASSWATASTDSADLKQGGPSGALLGRFAVPNTSTPANTYQIYTWVPLTDVAGNLVEWDTDGSQQTLTLMVNQGSYNVNFFMLMPVNPNYKPKPFISDLSPDGSKVMFADTNLLTFTANSVPGIAASNVVVTLNGVPAYGVTTTGSPHVLNVSCPLATNVAYAAVITLTDANGSSTFSDSFGTYATNNYTWECEDWDYNGGQFFDNPQIDAYAGLSGIQGVDANNNQSGAGAAYRDSSNAGNLGNEVNGDIKRAQYVAANTNDYDIGWTASGEWANYTRTYPKGEFNVLMRAAGNTGGNDRVSLLRVNADQSTTTLGRFDVPNTGSWQTYAWAPMVDAEGNAAVITNSGSVTTLRMNEDNGGWNGNFFMLAPVDTTRPVLSQLYPDGALIFQPTNTLAFKVSSAAGLDPSLLKVTLNGTVLSGLVTSASGNTLSVSWPHLQPNTSYAASITVNTTNNDALVKTFTFDTFGSSNYTWEAEDYDYNSGQFIDNPQLDGYISQAATLGVDALSSSGGGAAYRPAGDGSDLGNEVTGDAPRTQYLAAGTNDYDIGWTAAGNWANYTRTYPKGAFNVFMRGSSPTTPSGQTNAASLWRVTGGVGTATQTTNLLGVFNVPLTGGYQNYTFVPLVDLSGNLVTVTNSGAVSTFQLNEDAGGWNVNFFMLVPAVTQAPALTAIVSGQNIVISWAPSGGTLQSTPALGGTWTAVGTANPATIPMSGNAMFFRVSNP